jgi:hypothetical protein
MVQSVSAAGPNEHASGAGPRSATATERGERANSILAHADDYAVERALLYGAAGFSRKPSGEDKTPRYDQACDWTAGRNDNWMGYASRCSVGRRMDVLRGGLPSWMDWRVRLRVRDGADHPLQHCTEYR